MRLHNGPKKKRKKKKLKKKGKGRQTFKKVILDDG